LPSGRTAAAGLVQVVIAVWLGTDVCKHGRRMRHLYYSSSSGSCDEVAAAVWDTCPEHTAAVVMHCKGAAMRI
jgi:hypothetical protein